MKIKQKLYSLLIFIILMFSGLSYTTTLQTQTYYTAGKKIQLAEKNVNLCDDILISILNMETGARGYYIGRDAQFLEPFIAAKPVFEKSTRELKILLTPKLENEQLKLTEVVNINREWTTLTENNFSEMINIKSITEYEKYIRTTSFSRKKLIDRQRAALNEIKEQQLDSQKQIMVEIDAYTRQISTAIVGIFFLCVTFSSSIIILLIRDIDKEAEKKRYAEEEVKKEQEKEQIRRNYSSGRTGI